MKIKLISMGKHMPSWVIEGFAEYAKRFPATIKFELVELTLPKRQKTSVLSQLIITEGDAMLTKIQPSDHVIALDMRGEAWDTLALAKQLQSWQEMAHNVSLLVGGPDGLAPACLTRANQCWSLSNLTMPHPLVRIVVAEQLYRAWTIISGHPYHR